MAGFNPQPMPPVPPVLPQWHSLKPIPPIIPRGKPPKTSASKNPTGKKNAQLPYVKGSTGKNPTRKKNAQPPYVAPPEGHGPLFELLDAHTPDGVMSNPPGHVVFDAWVPQPERSQAFFETHPNFWTPSVLAINFDECSSGRMGVPMQDLLTPGENRLSQPMDPIFPENIEAVEFHLVVRFQVGIYHTPFTDSDSHTVAWLRRQRMGRRYPTSGTPRPIDSTGAIMDPCHPVSRVRRGTLRLCRLRLTSFSVNNPDSPHVDFLFQVMGQYASTEPDWSVGTTGLIPIEKMRLATFWHETGNVWRASVRVPQAVPAMDGLDQLTEAFRHYGRRRLLTL